VSPTPQSEPSLEILVDDLVAGDTARCDEMFRLSGAKPPVVIWEPAAEDLWDPRLRDLRAAWTAEREQCEGLPHFSWVEPGRVPSVIGFLMLLQVEQGGADFRYRLYGTEISRRFMVDLTGRRVSEVPVAMSRLFFLAVYRAAIARGEPVFTWHAPPLHVHVTSWARLILPLAGDHGAIERFLVGNIPGSWRGPDSGPMSMSREGA